jgi:hypothetical protein
MKIYIPILIISMILVIIVIIFLPKSIEIPETSEVILVYNYDDKKIYEIINNKNEIMELKTLLKGNVIKDNPSCGFSEDISITFTGENNLMLCPALDSCGIIRIGTTNRYINISENNRKKLELFLGKYGFKFPSV